jgi:hypothetical protein
VHAVSLTPHAKYDTACTIDERFERPWQHFGYFGDFQIDLLGVYKAISETALARESGP